MIPHSPVPLHHPIDDASPDRGFFALIKHWMGRIVSIALEAPVSLYRLLFRVQSVANPIIVPPSPHHSPAPLKKEQITQTPPTDKKFPSPVQKKEDVTQNSEVEEEDIFEEEEESLPILEGFFKNMGLDINTSLKEVLSKGLIFDLTGKKLESVDLDKLTGTYQVEWNIEDEEDEENDFILLYKGEFVKGVFHGQGAFSKQESDGSLYSLLEGTFKLGTFKSGMMVLDDSYIEGTFNRGYRNGKGIIHYFKTDSHSTPSFRIEYHGEFIQGIPHGKGKVLSIETDTEENDAPVSGSVKLLAEGEFKDGQIVKGRYQEEDGRIFTGEWLAGDRFKGRIVNCKEGWSYEGNWIKGKFEGQGTLTKLDHYEYNDLEPAVDETEESEEMILVNKEGVANSVFKGEFKDGAIFNGEQKIKWPGEKVGTVTFENGNAVKTEISTPQGLKYVGKFTSFTLDGQGKIYDAENHQLYSGSIKCGYPHGKGCLQEGNEVKEGVFEWGKLVESESTESE